VKNIFAMHAAKYAYLGWQIFPQALGAKTPIKGTAGLKESSANRAQIQVWCKQYPDANIGMLCGPESKVCVIDIDARSGGHETVSRLASQGFVLPPTVEAASAGNGRHLYYAFDDRVAVSGSNKLGRRTKDPKEVTGIDILTTGHAVTLPPSYSRQHNRQYLWVRAPMGSEFPRLPKWVIDTLKPVPPPIVPMREIDYSNLQGYQRQALADLDEMRRRVAALRDGRHEAPFKVGAALGAYVHHRVLNVSDVENAIMGACQRNGALRKYRPNDLRKQIMNGLAKARADSLPPLARTHRQSIGALRG
jgi:Bifunctional DNA primase/polymerase, N-terminal